MSRLETLDELGDTDISTLLSRANAMDVQAMNALLERLTPFVWRLCLPIAERHSADATQEAMLAIFRGIGSLHEPRALYAWVRAVTVRAAVLTSKRLNRSTVSELADSAQEADPYASSHIRDVISRLPDHHRQVLVLRAVYDMNEQEIAAMLSLPVGTVRSRLHRARLNFRAAWHGAQTSRS